MQCKGTSYTVYGAGYNARWGRERVRVSSGDSESGAFFRSSRKRVARGEREERGGEKWDGYRDTVHADHLFMLREMILALQAHRSAFVYKNTYIYASFDSLLRCATL